MPHSLHIDQKGSRWTRVDKGIYKQEKRWRVVWYEPHSETGNAQLKSKSFPLDTPLEKLTAFRDGSRRAALTV